MIVNESEIEGHCQEYDLHISCLASIIAEVYQDSSDGTHEGKYEKIVIRYFNTNEMPATACVQSCLKTE
jgi:hypothetical protein